jgi:hypothetical protein
MLQFRATASRRSAILNLPVHIVHRVISAEQAEVLGQAIANYRNLKKLLRGWETETERLIDAAESTMP